MGPIAPFIPAIIGAGVAVFSVSSAKKAAARERQALQGATGIQSEATDKALALQESMFNTNVELQMPWIEAGEWALGELVSGIKSGAFDPGEFTFTFDQDDPSYKWRFDQGERAVTNAAVNRGGLLSGRAAKELTRFGQGMASTEYQNEFNRDLLTYQTNSNRLTNNYNRLAGVANTGQAATNNLSTLGSNYANNAGNLIISAGNNQANALYGSARINTAKQGAYANAFNNLGQGIIYYGNTKGWFDPPPPPLLGPDV